ncbi:MAG: hypothetical protein RR404_01115 [Bacilli bacterium]
MKNDKFIKSLDTIIPSKTEKAKIFEKITKKKFGFHTFSMILTISLCSILFVLSLNQNKKVESISLNRTIENSFSYKGTCYAESKVISKENLGEFLFTIEDGMLKGLKVYKNRNNENMIVSNNDFYIEYERCK